MKKSIGNRDKMTQYGVEVKLAGLDPWVHVCEDKGEARSLVNHIHEELFNIGVCPFDDHVFTIQSLEYARVKAEK